MVPAAGRNHRCERIRSHATPAHQVCAKQSCLVRRQRQTVNLCPDVSEAVIEFAAEMTGHHCARAGGKLNLGHRVPTPAYTIPQVVIERVIQDAPAISLKLTSDC